MSHDDQTSHEQQSEFERLGKKRRLSLVGEFMFFIAENKKWWLAPLVVALGLVGLLAILGSTGAAPFIYTFF